MTEKIFPLPLKKSKFGQDVSKLTAGDYYRQLVEKILEANQAYISNQAYILRIVNKILTRDGYGQCAEQVEKIIGIDGEAEKLVDIMTWCVTRLEQIGYDADARQILYATANAKNYRLGYFGDDSNA